MSIKVQEILEQTKLLKNEVDTNRTIASNRDVYDTKTRYQMEMTQSLKSLNTYILFFYYFLFVLIHGLFAEQYFRGIHRNEVVDSIVFTGFFVYPAVIYFVESYIYFGITYILSFIYGTTYVYNFNKLFTTTNFYEAPVAGGTSISGLPSLTVNLT